jgi:hypothetical protein
MSTPSPEIIYPSADSTPLQWGTSEGSPPFDGLHYNNLWGVTNVILTYTEGYRDAWELDNITKDNNISYINLLSAGYCINGGKTVCSYNLGVIVGGNYYILQTNLNISNSTISTNHSVSPATGVAWTKTEINGMKGYAQNLTNGTGISLFKITVNFASVNSGSGGILI